MVGLLVALGIHAVGFEAFVGSPIYATALLIFLGLIAGLLLGGLVSLRPDQACCATGWKRPWRTADAGRWSSAPGITAKRPAPGRRCGPAAVS